MKWEFRTLGEIGEWGSGGTPLSSTPDYYNGTIPWLIIEDLNDSIVTSSQRTITELGLKNSSAKIVEPGTLLIAMYGSIGKLGIAGIRCATNQAIAFCRHNPELINVDFLFYYLLYSREKLLELGKGNTQQNIGQSVLKEYPIPLPLLTEQKRIASLLRRADRLRQLRQTAHELGDELLQSVFLEMFGDPLTNEMGWKIEKLSKTFSIKPQIGTPYPAHAGGKYLVVRVGEIGGKKVDLENSQRITLNEKELERFRLKTGDFLLARAIGSEDHLGKASILQETNDVIVYDSHVMRLRFDTKIMLPVFFWHWLKSDGGRARFMQRAGRTAVQFNVNTEQIAEVDIPLPALNLQEEFAGVVRRVEALRGRMSEAERQVERLFDALLAEAFRTA